MGNRSLCQAFPSVDIVLLMEKTPRRSDISAAGNADNIGDREGVITFIVTSRVLSPSHDRLHCCSSLVTYGIESYNSL